MAVTEKQAKERIPKQYWDYLIMIHDRPYMQVDGRTAMLIDEQRKSGEPLTIEFKTQWTLEAEAILAMNPQGTAEALIAQLPPDLHNILTCIVEIGGRRAEGSAKINWGGSGVDKTNPYENAQTSAYGRALGLLGYGLLGTGIASAEEVKAAIAEREKAEEDKPSGMPGPRPAPESSAATPGPTGATTSEASLPPATTSAVPPTGGEALTQTEGPCVDCGQEFVGLPGKAMTTWILTQRKKGQQVRWSHTSVPKQSCPAKA